MMSLKWLTFSTVRSSPPTTGEETATSPSAERVNNAATQNGQGDQSLSTGAASHLMTIFLSMGTALAAVGTRTFAPIVETLGSIQLSEHAKNFLDVTIQSWNEKHKEPQSEVLALSKKDEFASPNPKLGGQPASSVMLNLNTFQMQLQEGLQGLMGLLDLQRVFGSFYVNSLTLKESSLQERVVIQNQNTPSYMGVVTSCLNSIYIPYALPSISGLWISAEAPIERPPFIEWVDLQAEKETLIQQRNVLVAQIVAAYHAREAAKTKNPKFDESSKNPLTLAVLLPTANEVLLSTKIRELGEKISRIQQKNQSHGYTLEGNVQKV